MTKTSRTKLIRDVQDNLVTYLGSGEQINQNEISKKLTKIEYEVSDFTRLLEIRFVISPFVKRYVDTVAKNIQNIKTSKINVSNEARGVVKGSIDWGQTIKARYDRGINDTSIYVTKTPETEYNLPENILVKKLLSIIRDILMDDVKYIDQNWRRDIWPDEEINKFDRLYQENVYLNRIRVSSSQQITDSELNAARNARSQLYNEAYDLYLFYEDLLNYTFKNQKTMNLLQECLTVPETSTLFELSCIFSLIEIFKNNYDTHLVPIKTGMGPIAILQNNRYTLKIYHDSTGPVDLTESIPENPLDDYLMRYSSVLEQYASFRDIKNQNIIYRGRPDLIITVQKNTEASELNSVIIGEFKHTINKQTISKGTKELIEYLYYSKILYSGTSHYLNDISEVDLYGFVITDGDYTPILKDNILQLSYQNLRSSDTQNHIQKIV